MGISLVGLFLTDDMSEFKNSSELDDTIIKSIRNEFFKKTFVFPFVVSIISAVVGFLMLPGVIPVLNGSDFYYTVAMIVVPLCGAMATMMTVRWIFSLIILSRIKKNKFLWYTGFIRGKNWRYPVHFSKMHKYYSIDDKYFALLSVNPIYKKLTPVYFLYFPGLSKPSIGGAVVKYEL